MVRGAEHGEEPVAEKLVYDAVVLVDGPHHEGPQRVQVAHHLIRRTGLGERGEIADIEHHHTHLAQLGVPARRLVEELIHYDRRYVLTKERHDPLALSHFADGLDDGRAKTLADKRGRQPAAE